MHQLESSTDQLILQGDFPAFSRQELFDYWVTPTLLAKWWPTEADVLPGPGGSYKFSWPSMGWVLQGRYEEFIPGERLVFTWKWNHEPADIDELRVTLVFEDSEEGGALLTIKQGPYRECPVEQQDRQGHIEGWIHFCMKLSGLKDGVQDTAITL